MTRISKGVSEVQWEFDSYRVDLEQGFISLLFQMSNSYMEKASLGAAKWQSPATGEYLPLTLASQQVEDLSALPLTARRRLVEVVWDAAEDLRIMQAFPAVTLAFSFWDRPNQGGRETPVQEFQVPVDFTLSALGRGVKMVRPLDHDPYFDFEFLTPLLIRPGRLHFKLELDQAESFDSPAYIAADSDLDQTYWTADGGSFPADGVDGTAVHRVKYAGPELDQLAAGDWYYRLQVRVSQFRARITAPQSGQVFNSTTIQVQGVVEYD